jgi:hypothetical protein
MKLNILYNFPLGENSAQVTLGMASADDSKYQFRIGLIDGQGSGGWLKPGWVNHDGVDSLKGMVKKDWKIRLEKKEKGTDNIVARHEIDCSKEWPVEAEGASCVDTGYFI